jgi:hypothetical protein
MSWLEHWMLESDKRQQDDKERLIKIANELIVNYPTASCGALREREPPHSRVRTGPLSSPQQAEGYSAVIFIKVVEIDDTGIKKGVSFQ